MARKQIKHVADLWSGASPYNRHGQVLFAGGEGREFCVPEDYARGNARIRGDSLVSGIASGQACAWPAH